MRELGDQQPSLNHGELFKGFPHGTMYAYRRGCRCVPCKRERSDVDLRYKGRERQYQTTMGMAPDHPEFPHGTQAGYRYCKCDRCRAANNQRKLELNAKYRQAEAAKVKQQQLNAQYARTEEGRARRRAANAARKAGMKLTQCSKAERELIARIYAACPVGYQVDHAVPIAAGGEHRPHNLQYLPAAVNNAKRARTDFDVSAHVIRWQDVIEEGSTTIPQGSRAKRPEVPSTPRG